MWLRFARCVARSVIVVAGKFASILICGLAAELRNSQPQSVLRFCVFGGQGFFWVDFSWSAFRNSQPQSVLRFCVFGGQGFFGLTVTGRFVATHSHNQFCVFAETFDEYR